jgi:hypothetical protein
MGEILCFKEAPPLTLWAEYTTRARKVHFCIEACPCQIKAPTAQSLRLQVFVAPASRRQFFIVSNPEKSPARRRRYNGSRSNFLKATVACFNHVGRGHRAHETYPRKHQKNGMYAFRIDHESNKHGSNRRCDS